MTQLFSIDEYLKCPNYENGSHSTFVEKHLTSKQILQLQSSANKMIFILKGDIKCNGGSLVGEGNFLFLAAGSYFSCQTHQGAELLILNLANILQFCDCFRIEDLQQKLKVRKKNEKISIKDTPFALPVNDEMKKYLNGLLFFHRKGLRCYYYNEGKVKELMYILRFFYSKDNLRQFFAPALTADLAFSQFIMSNYANYNSLTELAAAMNYSVSGFEKKFRKVFACSPYKWIRKRKALNIFHHIKSTNLSLGQISDHYGFSSPAAFNTFIKQNFGMTPGQIRQYKVEVENDDICADFCNE